MLFTSEDNVGHSISLFRNWKERFYVCSVSSETGKCLRAKASYASERDIDLPPSESAKKN